MKKRPGFHHLHARINLIHALKHDGKRASDKELRCLWLDRPTEEEAGASASAHMIAAAISSMVPKPQRVDLVYKGDALTWAHLQERGEMICLDTLAIKHLAPELFREDGSIHWGHRGALHVLDTIEAMIAHARAVETPEAALEAIRGENTMLTYRPANGEPTVWPIVDPIAPAREEDEEPSVEELTELMRPIVNAAVGAFGVKPTRAYHERLAEDGFYGEPGAKIAKYRSREAMVEPIAEYDLAMLRSRTIHYRTGEGQSVSFEEYHLLQAQVSPQGGGRLGLEWKEVGTVLESIDTQKELRRLQAENQKLRAMLGHGG